MPTTTWDGFQETIIVGGGMAGLGCAHRLRQHGQPFLLVSPEIGGRVRTSPDGRVNYGAYYVTADYDWTLPFVKLVDTVRVTDCWFHRGGHRYTLLSPRLIKHLPALLRFTSDLRRFRRRYNDMNALASNFPRRELIESNNELRNMYYQPASQYIRERKLESLFADYIEHLLWASFFHDPREVSTFFLMAASLPLVVPMYSFEFDRAAATADIESQILDDSVEQIDMNGEMIRVATRDGRQLACRQLVLATPIALANRLLGPGYSQPTRQGIDVSYYHVRGKLRNTYQGPARNFFPVEDGAVLSREQDGSFLYFYRNDYIDRYFSQYEVITHDTWKTAMS
ncbi:MAG: FAD-dependent oxidoreductase, partial [Planctomycetales bacterium]|nr:FAD-dependent oxidoreductase [Planctomycetales bacterium]